MDAEQVGEHLIGHAERLEKEIHRVWKVFDETKFLGDNGNLPYAHCGYLMGLLSLVDVLAICDLGEQSGVTQSERMRIFLNGYVWPGRTQPIRVLVQMLRHTLMHTGGLNYVYDAGIGTAYIWRWVGYGEDVPEDLAHATITEEPYSMMPSLPRSSETA